MVCATPSRRNITSHDAITSRIDILNRHIDSVIQLDDRQLLEIQLNRMKILLLDINNEFQHQQKEALKTVNNLLERMEYRVRWAKLLIHRSKWS